MANQFTHRQDSVFAHTSICLKCFRVVATRDRESELRADEVVHSCMISLSRTRPDPGYWGILCRTCTELVAFGTIPAQNFGPGAEGSKPRTIRCNRGHTHIYFPRDFRLYPSVVAIADATMRENLKVYKAINPSWGFRDAPPTVLANPKARNETDLETEARDGVKVRSITFVPDPRREIAKKAAKDRWASWALRKLAKPQ
jgi:hypothetical protein